MSEYDEISSDVSEDDSGLWLSVFHLRILTFGLVLLSAAFFILGMLIGQLQTQPEAPKDGLFARNGGTALDSRADEGTASKPRDRSGAAGEQVSPLTPDSFLSLSGFEQEEARDDEPADSPKNSLGDNSVFTEGRDYPAPPQPDEQSGSDFSPSAAVSPQGFPSEEPGPAGSAGGTTARETDGPALASATGQADEGTPPSAGPAAQESVSLSGRGQSLSDPVGGTNTGRYALQVFASKGSREEAERFAKKYPDMTFTIDGPDNGYFRVYAGVYDSQQAASKRKKELRKREGFADCWIRVLSKESD